MVRRKNVKRQKINVQSPRSSTSAKQLNVLQLTTTQEKKRKKKKHSLYMPVGSKLFTISAKILKEIKRYQTSTDNLIPKLPFARLVQEIMFDAVPEGMRIQRVALEALQEATECYLVQYLEDSYICTLHARRVTLNPRDMELVARLRGTI